MSLYPSLEELHVDKILRVQRQLIGEDHGKNTEEASSRLLKNTDMYPKLVDFMGLDIKNLSLFKEETAINDDRSTQHSDRSQDGTLQNNYAQPTQVITEIREYILCKDASGKVGLRVQSINTGIFVCIVVKNSPAAIAGLKFGDQILEINGVIVAGYSIDKVHQIIKASGKNNISVIVRNRPFARTIALHKDSKGRLGFQFVNGVITAIFKDSSAARNGVLTDYNLLEVNYCQVVGVKDREIVKIIESAGSNVKITIIPSFIYQHMVKKLSGTFLREVMGNNICEF